MADDGRPTRFVFRPILHVRAGAVAGFVCQPQHRAAEDDDDFVACTAAAADLPSLGRATAELDRARRDGRQVNVTAGVHCTTLARSVDRRRCLARCARLAEVDRRHLLFKLAGCDESVPQTRLMELIGARTISCAHNLPTPGLAGMAIAAGLDFVDGAAVGVGGEQAEAAYRFPASELFDRIAPARASA